MSRLIHRGSAGQLIVAKRGRWITRFSRLASVAVVLSPLLLPILWPAALLISVRQLYGLVRGSEWWRGLTVLIAACVAGGSAWHYDRVTGIAFSEFEARVVEAYGRSDRVEQRWSDVGRALRRAEAKEGTWLGLLRPGLSPLRGAFGGLLAEPDWAREVHDLGDSSPPIAMGRGRQVWIRARFAVRDLWLCITLDPDDGVNDLERWLEDPRSMPDAARGRLFE